MDNFNGFMVEPNTSNHNGLELKHPVISGGSCFHDVVYSCVVDRPPNVYAPAIRPMSLDYEYVCSSSNGNSLLHSLYPELKKWLTLNICGNRVSKKYKAALDMVIANLITASQYGMQLLVPRGRRAAVTHNPDVLGYTLVTNTIDFLRDDGLIKFHMGIQEKDLGYCSWCVPSSKLIGLILKHDTKAHLHKHSRLIELRHGDRKFKREKRLLKIPKARRREASRLEAPVIAYSQLWLNHVASLDGMTLTPWVRRIFNGTLSLGGRFYGDFQQLPKADRRRILIDGEETCEPDFSGFHTYILYAWAGIQLNSYPYDIEGLDQNLVKAVLLRLLNSESKSILSGQITKSANANTKAAYDSWVKSNQFCNTNWRSSLKPSKPDCLQGFIPGIPAGTSANDL